MKTHVNKQLTDFLRESVRLGERILKNEEPYETLFNEYLERMEELINYLSSYRGRMNLLVSWKADALELYNPKKDYRPQWSRFSDRLRFLLRKKNIASTNNNIAAYIQRQNLLMSAIEFYYRHQEW
jgi:hypothetical protein